MDTPKSRAYIEKVNSGGFSIRHTSGENLPSSPLLSPQQRARKHASVSPEKPLAGERPRLQRLPASPKLERRKALKFDELLLEEESAWVALLNTTSPADATVVAGSLVRIFATEGRDNSIVKYCIMMEVAAAGAHTVPFRSPGIYSAVVLQSCLHHARIYLHDVLGPVLTDLVHKSNLGFEIDPRYVGTEEVARNLQNLTHVADHLLAAMLISVDLLPIPLRRIYRFAQRCIEGTYPAAAALIPGRLFFTHLVCEALLRPEEYGLAKGKLSDAVMRAHILLAKMLRCVGEETGPSEECMLPLVQWMNKAVTSARRFFKLALNVVATDTLDNHPGLLKLHSLPNPLAKQDRAFLTKFVCDNQVRFRWELVSLQAESALHALRSIVPEKVSPSVMRKVPIPVAEGEGSSTVSSS